MNIIPATPDAIEAFQDRYIPEPNTGCWIWTGSIGRAGYGFFQHSGVRMFAHRFSLVAVGTELTPEACADHKCRVRCCVRPDHLRLVTRATNTLENSNSESAFNKNKMVCKKGHQFNEANTIIYINPSGKPERKCRVCRDAYSAMHSKNNHRRIALESGEERPLFVPLKREYFCAFKAGLKTYEYRKYGPKWNEVTCRIGREVALSLGYGKEHRLQGWVTSFEVREHVADIPGWTACYGDSEANAAVIGITLTEPAIGALSTPARSTKRG